MCVLNVLLNAQHVMENMINVYRANFNHKVFMKILVLIIAHKISFLIIKSANNVKVRLIIAKKAISVNVYNAKTHLY